ncbi:exodeoxyribonuclease III [Sedimentibacter sp. zth1]|uniref:exodeoxyribonuclease III n=1 Tax=Sedimentibacter sp. zth1 TaxID=2816908 RepID=UPI001A923105|nr:exodeoxyribonuclease III [Sedimentibacter sp. zth1]QSX06524.1 exodeoxyribonuclease III [Sedimentibacter sp. zth1]
MKIVSWNVNGLRACITKGFMNFFNEVEADIFCLQEIKMMQDQAEIITPNYYQYWNSANKKGYSGTLIFSKKEPLSYSYGINGSYTDEGRLITLEFDNFYIVNCYSPNAKVELARIDYRMEFEDCFRKYLVELSSKKPVVMCGDLNVAHNEIDLKNPKSNIGNAGFSYEEREKFNNLLLSGFTDSFRYLYPDVKEKYTWWSYRFKARQNNAGWRIDYLVVSDCIKDKISDSIIHADILGSDHCPISLIIDL